MKPPAEQRALWIDGRFVDPSLPHVSPFDVAWRSGHGAFESFSLRRDPEGVHALFDAHLTRLRAAAVALGLGSWPSFDLSSICEGLLDRASLDVARARVSLHREGARPRLVISVEEGEDLVARRARGVRLATSPLRFGRDDPTPGYKCEGRVLYELARADAVERGADEALLVDESGAALETTRASIFIVDTPRSIATPPLRGRSLPGVARNALLQAAPRGGIEVAERELGLATLLRAPLVFLSNAVVGIEPVRSIDGSLLPNVDHSLEARKVLDQCLQLLRRSGMGC